VKQLKKISKMEEKQKSAVEFLESQYHFNKQLSARDFKEAKEMEGSQATMKTAVEKIIAEIDNEVDFLKTHQYIAEVRGRMIGLAFAKRVALELKEMEKQQRGYSEEEVLVLLHKRDNHNIDNPNTFNGWLTPKEWFEQFKQQEQ
jgi:hypothetical protein